VLAAGFLNGVHAQLAEKISSATPAHARTFSRSSKTRLRLTHERDSMVILGLSCSNCRGIRPNIAYFRSRFNEVV
jgi:hypothetical protein